MVAVLSHDGGSSPEHDVGLGVARLDPAGGIEWSYAPDRDVARVTASPLLHDLDHDGRFEVIASLDHALHILDAVTGERLSVLNIASEEIESQPAPIDVDDDGVDELIVGAHDRLLRCVEIPVLRGRQLGAR